MLKEKYINPFTDFGFKKLFKVAEIAMFEPVGREIYEDSLKNYRDLVNSIDTAEQDGKEKGKKEKAFEIAKKCLKKGMNIEDISELTGITKNEIKNL